jgi:hypothetical protein
MSQTYQELKVKQSAELNNFKGVFFAFDKRQFNEGMKRIGLDPSDTDKIYNLGNTGGYILKEKSPEYKAMFDRHEQELAEQMKDKDFLYDALVYELCNHEYCITQSCTDALYALGINEEDIDVKVLIKACKEANTEL